MERKKVLFFDWDGTLCLNRFWHHFENPSHTRHSIFPLVQEALFVKNPDLIKSWMVGNVTSEDVLNHISSQANLDADILLQELEISCRSMQLISPEVLDVIDRLRTKYLTAIATDNMDTFTRWTVPSLNLHQHFDGILNSYDLKSSKRVPHNFFTKFLSDNNISPEDCTIIDDAEDRENAISQYGFKYIKITRGGLMSALESIS